MDETLRRKILEILSKQRIMSLATVRPDGWPQATTVGYVSDGLNLYFLCGLDSQKARNLAHDDRVSLTINDDPADIMQIAGLSMAGRARRVEDRGLAQKVLSLMPLKYPDSPPLPLAMPSPDQIHIFCVTPTVVSVLDYSRGFGHADLVNV